MIFPRHLKRLYASTIDGIVLFFSAFIYLMATDELSSYVGTDVATLVHLTGFALIWFILLLLESIDGQTPGKYLMSQRVATMNGQTLRLRHTFIRHLADPIDFFVGGLMISIAILKGRDMTRRVGDFIAGTAVIPDRLVTCPHCRAVSTPSVPEIANDSLVCPSCKHIVRVTANS